MDLRKLKTLIDLVAESGIAELEITEGEDKVRIVKFSQTVSPVAYAPAPVAAAPAPAGMADSAAAPAPAVIVSTALLQHHHIFCLLSYTNHCQHAVDHPSRRVV